MRATSAFSSAQCRAARGLLDWSQERLAIAAGLDLDELQAFESDQGELDNPQAAALAAVFTDAGVIPLDAAWAGEGVRFRSPDGAHARFARRQRDQGLPSNLRHLPLAERVA